MSLMVDFNQRLHLGDALERCHAIDDLGLAWIEEPILYDNFEGYARLTADLKTPIQIGENFYGPRTIYTALQMKACDYVMPDFMRIGGVTGWQRAAAIAAGAGIPISTHLYPEVAAHVMRVSETAHWLEWQDWANPILQQPYEVKDGKPSLIQYTFKDGRYTIPKILDDGYLRVGKSELKFHRETAG